MKEIIAFIRPSKMKDTKKILDDLNVSSVTAIPVLGRGDQRGINTDLSGIEINKQIKLRGRIMGMQFVPKRMLVIVAKETEVDTIVNAISTANRTGNVGDGKIFVCPTDNAINIRSKVSGEAAL